MSIYDQRIEELLAEYRERRAKTGELHRKITEISASATAPRTVVTVTVNAQGRVSSLEFPTGAYKRMAPADLARTLMDTIGEATDKALDAVRELMTPELPPGLNFIDLLQGKAELGTALPENPPIPDAVQDFIGYRPGRAGGGQHE